MKSSQQRHFIVAHVFSVNQFLAESFEKTTGDDNDKQVMTTGTVDGNRISIIDVQSEKEMQKKVGLKSLAVLNFRCSFVNLLLFMTGLLTNRI